MSTDGLQARMEALELIFKEDDFGSRLRELEGKVADLESKGPAVHTFRLDTHDKEIAGLKKRSEEMFGAITVLRNACIEDFAKVFRQLANVSTKADTDRLYALMERLLESHQLVATHLKLVAVNG